jgi:hypothetical protein
MGKSDYKEFKDGIKKTMVGYQNFEQAIEEFNLLIEKFKKNIRKKLENISIQQMRVRI